ncbi:unnamed protein product, partial [marine sediment metagenome]
MYKENKIKLLKSISGIAIGILLILVTGFNIPVIDSFADSYFDTAIKKAGVSVVKDSDIELNPAGVGVFLAVGKVLDPVDDMTDKAGVGSSQPPIIEGEYHLPSKGWAEMIRHLELTFEAERPPPPRVVQ